MTVKTIVDEVLRQKKMSPDRYNGLRESLLRDKDLMPYGTNQLAASKELTNEEAAAKLSWVQALVTAIKNQRTQYREIGVSKISLPDGTARMVCKYCSAIWRVPAREDHPDNNTCNRCWREEMRIEDEDERLRLEPWDLNPAHVATKRIKNGHKPQISGKLHAAVDQIGGRV